MNERDEDVREMAELMLAAEPINIDINNCRQRVLMVETILREPEQLYTVEPYNKRYNGFAALQKYTENETKPAKPVLQPVKPARTIKRNATCPCGSGRKYKVCCRNK